MPDAKVHEAMDLLEDYLGIEGARKLAGEQGQRVGELMDLIGDARVAVARTRSAWSWLVRAPVSWWGIGVLVAVSGVVLGGGGWLAARYKNEIGDAWPAIWTVVTEIGAVFAMLTQWGKRHLGKVSRGLDQFEKVRQDIDKKLAAERAKFEAELQATQKERADAVAELKRAEAALKAAEEKVAQAEQDLRESRSAHRIARLIEQRLTGKDYEQYLGIVATIRADFQTLSDLMKKMRRERASEQDTAQPIDRIQFLSQCHDDEPLESFEKQVHGRTHSAEKPYVESALAAYRKVYGETLLRLRDLRHWGPQVARFSFRSGRT